MNCHKERENAETDKRIKATEHDLHKLQERVCELTKISEHKDYDLKKTSEAYDATHMDLLRARDEAARLQEEQCQQQRSLDCKQAEKCDLIKRLEAERARNHSLTAQLYDLEGKCRNTEQQLACAKQEQNDLRFSNQSLQGQNADIQSEIDALQHHCNVLISQNRDLTVELQRFVETDEQIRCTLNRRDRVDQLRNKTECEMRQSYQQLDRCSPRRRHHWSFADIQWVWLYILFKVGVSFFGRQN